MSIETKNNHFAEEIASFFKQYRVAFQSKDPEAICQLYSFPCTIWHNNQNHFFERGLFKENLSRLLTSYESRGFRKAEFYQFEFQLLAPEMIQAKLQWQLKDQQNTAFSIFKCIYLLSKGANSKISIFSVININETI